MSVKTIKKLIKGTNWRFETYNDFQRDISMEKYNILLNGIYKLKAINLFKTKWDVYKLNNINNSYEVIKEGMKLRNALEYCKGGY